MQTDIDFHADRDYYPGVCRNHSGHHLMGQDEIMKNKREKKGSFYGRFLPLVLAPNAKVIINDNLLICENNSIFTKKLYWFPLVFVILSGLIFLRYLLQKKK